MPMINNIKKNKMVVGAGPEWTLSLEEDIKERIDELKCIELIAENFIDNPLENDFIKKLKKHNTPVLIHCVGLSLATDAPLKNDHLKKVLKIADKVNALNISDHLSMTECFGLEIGQLTPVPFTMECADLISRKIEKIQKNTKLPFALEHVAYRFFYSKNELSETALINKILNRTGCGLILDLHNLYCNSKNNNYDPKNWLNEIDLKYVTSIHLAGGYRSDLGAYIDGHSDPVPVAVWQLLEFVLEKITPESIIVERTSNYPGIDEIMAEVIMAQNYLDKSLMPKTIEKKIVHNSLLEISL